MVKIEFLGPINKEDMNLDIQNLSQLSDILKEDSFDTFKNYFKMDNKLKIGIIWRSSFKKSESF